MIRSGAAIDFSGTEMNEDQEIGASVDFRTLYVKVICRLLISTEGRGENCRYGEGASENATFGKVR
jgi:hypothetical protein